MSASGPVVITLTGVPVQVTRATLTYRAAVRRADGRKAAKETVQ